MELGQRLAKLIQPPLLIELVGDLGGGKTALVKAIAKGLGVAQTITSPTFNIHRSYTGRDGLKFEHFDLYRLEDDEVVQNELRECLEDTNTVVCTEWANHFTKYRHEDRLTIECHYLADSERKYIFIPSGAKTIKIIEALHK